MKIQYFDQGLAFWQDKTRLTIMLLVPFYSFWPRYETRRAGCPIGLELIANELIAEGFNLIFVDACMSAYSQYTLQEDGTMRYGLTNKQLENVLAKFNPQIVGTTSMFSNQANNVDIVAGLTKQIYPQAIVIEGGAHASGDVNEVLKNSDVDMVMRGEGLKSFPMFCQSVESNLSSKHSTSILGLSYKDEIGNIIHNPNIPYILSLDELAPRRLEIPLHEMYNTPEHTGGSRFLKNGRHAYILSSEGCPLKCDFCYIHTMAGTIRYYSLERFEQEVALLKKAGVNELIIENDMFLADIPRAMAIGKILKKYNISWFEEGGLSMFKFMKPGDKLTYKDLIDNLSESGCYRYYMAIESANPESLRKSHKPHINTQEDLATKIINYTAHKNVEAVGGFMLGFKNNGFEESLGDMKKTVAYAKTLKEAGLAYVMLFIYTAIPGTNVYKSLKSVFPDYDLRTSHERAAFPVGGLTSNQLTKLRRQWMWEVNGKSCMNIAEETNNWGL